MSPERIQLVLLPGMDGTGKLFRDFIEALPSGIDATVLRYSSDRVQSDGELLQFLESSLPASDPFVLVAESFSTPFAIHLAAANKANLKGLVICAGFAASPIQGWRRCLCMFLSHVCFSIEPPSIIIRGFLVGRMASKSLEAEVKGAIGSVRPGLLAHRLRSTLTCDARSALRNVRVPILFLHPTQDKLIGPACLKEMRGIKPEAVVESISGPHLLLQARARESAEVIEKYARQFFTS